MSEGRRITGEFLAQADLLPVRFFGPFGLFGLLLLLLLLLVLLGLFGLAAPATFWEHVVLCFAFLL